ncbi:MAG: cytochrome c biogenesis protein CcsA [Nitrospirae bacterium]|nr:cytochrome c biogenesis protein CcsA [Candidatus Troglogloeales bacterium]
MSQIIFFRTSLFFYFLGCLLFLLNLWDKKGGTPPAETSQKSATLPISQRIAFVVTGVGFLCHTIALGLQLQSGVPFSSLKEAISFFSWAIVLIFFWVELKYQVYVMGSLILPMAFLSLISAATLPIDTHPVDPALKGTLLGVHTTLSVLGIVAFAIAAVSGMMYLVQERFLKSKQFGPLYYKLPSLDLLDQWNKTALFCGIPLLTLGIISGALWSQYARGFFWSSNSPKQLLSLSAWFFYLIVLQGRLTFGFRARRGALLSIIGFVGIIFIFTTLA